MPLRLAQTSRRTIKNAPAGCSTGPGFSKSRSRHRYRRFTGFDGHSRFRPSNSKISALGPGRLRTVNPVCGRSWESVSWPAAIPCVRHASIKESSEVLKVTSGFRTRIESAPAAARAPWLTAAAKPRFASFRMQRTPACSWTRSTVPSVDPLSTTVTATSGAYCCSASRQTSMTDAEL